MKKQTISTLTLAMLALMAWPGNAEAQSLDGRSFIVSSTDPSSGATTPDALTFSGGNFESLGCRLWGFAPAAYQSTTEGSGTTFTTVATSPTEGTMTWTGVVEGDHIRGTALWSKVGQDDITYPFDGQGSSNALDGSTLEISLTYPAGESEADRLVFETGRFESEACREWGFTPAPYSTAVMDGGVAFTAFAISPTEGVMVWNGRVADGSASGTATWVKEGQDDSTFSFTDGATP